MTGEDQMVIKHFSELLFIIRHNMRFRLINW